MTAARGTFILDCAGVQGTFPATHGQSHRGRLIPMYCLFLFLALLIRQCCVAANLMAVLNGNLLVF